MISKTTISLIDTICQDYYKNILLETECSLVEIINNKSRSSIEALDYLMRVGNCYEDVYPSHDRIAAKLGLSVRQAKRLTKKLQDIGLIKKVKRPYTSCMYYVNSALNCPWLRDKYASIFRAFKYLPLCMLLSSYTAPASNYEVDVPVLYLCNNYIYKQRGCLGRESIRTIKKRDRCDGYSSNSIHIFKKDMEREKMEHQKLSLIPEYVENCRIVHLAPNGKIELSVYPKEALYFAASVVNKKKFSNEKSKFFYLRKVAAAYCKDHNISVRYTFLSKMREYYKVSSSDEFVLDAIPVEAVQKKPVEEKRYSLTDFDPDEKNIPLHKIERIEEHPVIFYAKIYSYNKAHPQRARFSFAPEPEKPNIDCATATAIIEAYKKTDECIWSEKHHSYKLLNPFEDVFSFPTHPTVDVNRKPPSDNVDGISSQIPKEDYLEVEEEFPECEVIMDYPLTF